MAEDANTETTASPVFQTGSSVDVTKIVKTTRIVSRSIGALGLFGLLVMFTAPDASLFDYMIPVTMTVVGFEGLVLRAEITNNGTLLKIHSLFRPQRIPLQKDTKFIASKSGTWWSKGIEFPNIDVLTQGKPYAISSSHNLLKTNLKHIEFLYQAAGITPPEQRI